MRNQHGLASVRSQLRQDWCVWAEFFDLLDGFQNAGIVGDDRWCANRALKASIRPIVNERLMLRCSHLLNAS
ncbi:MAG: hypothetical protein SQA66_11440 [Candidatus Fervidibacter sacchari]